MQKNNVFINCPFDSKYKPLFESIIFTTIDCGYIPRCAKEAEDSSQLRLDKIVKIISECQYGIHDISRTETSKKTSLPRFNMPFELGLFYGALIFGDKVQKTKKYIVLEKGKYRYHKFLSDIKGMDIHDHVNKPQKVINKIRNWLATHSKDRILPSGGMIYKKYMTFREKFFTSCSDYNLIPKEITFVDYVNLVSLWLKRYKG